MIAPHGTRYVITLTLPSGSKFLCGDHEGKLALIPIGDGKSAVKVSKALSWTDSKEVSKWLKEFLSKMTPEQREGFLKMRPDLGTIKVEQ